MLKFLTTIAVLLWMVVGMAELVSLAPSPIDHPPVNGSEGSKANKCDEKGHPSLIRLVFCSVGGLVDAYHDDVTAVSTAIIAIFTVILGTFTISLARSTRVAAEAARESASIIPNLERAFVYVEDMTPTIGEPEKDINQKTQAILIV